MAPPSGLQQSASPPPDHDAGARFPPLARSSTLPGARPDPSHLAPEDAFYAASPPRRPSGFAAGAAADGLGEIRHRLRHKDEGSRSRSRRRKRTWKKLLWVKQSYPDNYTDQATFLENLQRNPRLQPYDFWPLVADSTVIVQHVCSVIIFVVCFIGIFQERLSPVSVVGWGSFATFLGWLLWDWWVGKETEGDGDGAAAESGGAAALRRPRPRPPRDEAREGPAGASGGAAGYESGLAAPTASNSSASNLPSAASSTSNLLNVPAPPQEQTAAQRQFYPGPTAGGGSSSSPNLPSIVARHAHSASASSLVSNGSQTSGGGSARGPRAGGGAASSPDPAGSAALRHRPSSPLRGGRHQLRMATVKSAILIYFTLLGLSPILKSLTRSTSSDSIWAMSFWLLTINIFFFDYSGGSGGSGASGSGSGPGPGGRATGVASLSTNAALMASTVLASRLPSTGQVFSLTLFSIEVFGLFPVFRRYARHRSWRYHVALTVLLVLGAGGGMGVVLGGGGGGAAGWPWKGGLAGMLVGCVIAALAMGGCSWWLIGLQKYKNEIYGPWDPARPIIISRRHWDDE